MVYRRFLAASSLILLSVLSACAAHAPASSPAGDVVKVFKSRGAVQCEGRGTAPEAMRAELERAGVRVQASAQVTDFASANALGEQLAAQLQAAGAVPAAPKQD